MAEPTLIQCTAACTVTVQHQFPIPVLDTDAAQGGSIAAAIGLVWAAAWTEEFILLRAGPMVSFAVKLLKNIACL